MTAWLSLGSDRGDRVAWLRSGLRLLAESRLALGARSSLYLTEPVGDPDLPWFVNCVVAVRQPPEPEVLLAACQQVEAACGRLRSPAEAARPEARNLDIDLVLYDDRLVDRPGIRVPHPRMHLRRFVLQPLAEIAPQVTHPELGRSAAELLRDLDAQERVWLLGPPPI